MKTLETLVYLTDNPANCRFFVSRPFPDEQADAMLKQRIDEHVRDGWRDEGNQRLIKDERTVEFSIRRVVFQREEPRDE